MRRTSLRRSMRVLTALSCLVAVLLGIKGAPVARETSFWTSETATDFRGGTPECVSVSRQGTVSLAPELDTLLSSDESYFWSLAEDGRGNVYVGSGDGGKIFKLNARGEVSVVLDSEELEILSLAVDDRGCVFAGTSPGGLVYKITPEGDSSVFFDSEESYIWCLTFDDAGNLYAGSGDKGRIYRIRRDGIGEVFYETGERHVMCARYGDGKLLVGTEGSGLVLSVSGPDEADVLYDCREEEVKDLVLGSSGAVYAAAVSRGKNEEVGAGQSDAQGFSVERGENKKLPSSVYRINADGTVLKLWGTSRSGIHSLWLAGEDSLIVGTGDDGTVYSLIDGELELLHKVVESQVLDIIGRNGGLLLSTGNRARVYSAGPAFCREGTLVSKTFDAVGVSRWGSLDWEAETPPGTSVAFRVRAGNSETPDRTWSDWSRELPSPGQISGVRSARFVQWKAVLRSGRGRSSPSLGRVILSYLEKNIAPSVGFVRVIPQGIPFDAGGIDKITERVSQTLPGGVKVEYSLVTDEDEHAVEQGAWARVFRTAVWEASDPNGDRQVFSVFYKGEEERNWKLLEEDWSELIYTWNTASFPDGTYVLKVVATDSPDNVPSEALSAENTSLPFEVDNTPPVVTELRHKAQQDGVRIEGNASDNMSPIVGLAYSLDGSGWKKLRASDGMLDSKDEKFSFLLEGLSADEHSVVVRVRDRAGNISTARVRVE